LLLTLLAVRKDSKSTKMREVLAVVREVGFEPTKAFATGS
jgi:hypothetical protein